MKMAKKNQNALPKNAVALSTSLTIISSVTILILIDGINLDIIVITLHSLILMKLGASATIKPDYPTLIGKILTNNFIFQHSQMYLIQLKNIFEGYNQANSVPLA